MYACMHVCMYACMQHVCMYACMHVCMYACMYVCLSVCLSVCLCVCMYVRTYVRTYVCMYVCMYIIYIYNMYICVCVSDHIWPDVYIIMYIYIYMRIWYMYIMYIHSVCVHIIWIWCCMMLNDHPCVDDCKKPYQGGWGASPWKPCVASASHTIKPKPFSFQQPSCRGHMTWHDARAREAKPRKPIEHNWIILNQCHAWVQDVQDGFVHSRAGVLVKVLDLPGKDSKFLSNRCKQTTWTYVDVCGRMWTYVDVCGRMWTYVDVCGRMWTYVDVCGRYVAYVYVAQADFLRCHGAHRWSPAPRHQEPRQIAGPLGLWHPQSRAVILCGSYWQRPNNMPSSLLMTDSYFKITWHERAFIVPSLSWSFEAEFLGGLCLGYHGEGYAWCSMNWGMFSIQSHSLNVGIRSLQPLQQLGEHVER